MCCAVVVPVGIKTTEFRTDASAQSQISRISSRCGWDYCTVIKPTSRSLSSHSLWVTSSSLASVMLTETHMNTKQLNHFNYQKDSASFSHCNILFKDETKIFRILIIIKKKKWPTENLLLLNYCLLFNCQDKVFKQNVSQLFSTKELSKCWKLYWLNIDLADAFI